MVFVVVVVVVCTATRNIIRSCFCLSLAGPGFPLPDHPPHKDTTKAGGTVASDRTFYTMLVRSYLFLVLFITGFVRDVACYYY